MPMKSELVHTNTNSLQEMLLAARLHNPYDYLGVHRDQDDELVTRVFQPYAVNVWIQTANGFESMTRIHDDGIFE